MDSTVLFVATIDACYSFGFIFIICDVCQRTSNAFDEIFEEIIQSDWYLFPEEIKQTLPIILADLQQPVVMRIFGNILGCRDTFKKVGSNP